MDTSSSTFGSEQAERYAFDFYLGDLADSDLDEDRETAKSATAVLEELLKRLKPVLKYISACHTSLVVHHGITTND